MVDSLITVDGDKVLLGITGQFTVEVCSRYDGLFVLSETLGSLFYDGENLRHHLIERFLIDIEHFLLYLVDLLENAGTFVNGGVLDGCLQFCNFGLLLFSRVLYLLLEFFGTLTERIVI